MNTGFLRHAVATVLTVYGIETIRSCTYHIIYTYVATVLTVYGIETNMHINISTHAILAVATVLTVYGIETIRDCITRSSILKVATVLTVYGIETRYVSIYHQ